MFKKTACNDDNDIGRRTAKTAQPVLTCPSQRSLLSLMLVVKF